MTAIRAGDTIVGRVYVHPLLGFVERLTGGTTTSSGTFVAMKANGVPGYFPEDLDLVLPEDAMIIDVAWRGKPALELTRHRDGHWEIRRWNFKGDLVNTGGRYSSGGVKLVLDYYANVSELPKWAYPLQKILRKAASLA